jgi:hypothetical protein
MIPLADPDLPEHLAMGEWIVRHRAVPFTEPFAWTRSGAPYYAYSWLAEALYYALFQAIGPFALRLLHGIGLAASLLSVWFLGRSARWAGWARLAAIGGTIWVYLIVAPYLRPQESLFTLVPLSWAFGYRILDPQRKWWPNALALAVVSVLAANVHLFFVLCALPVWLFLALPVPRPRGQRAVALVAAPLIGWMVTPYALVWPSVFRLYFAPNPLMRWPSVIAELQPGAQAMLHAPYVILVAMILAALPWSLNVLRRQLSKREICIFGMLWTAGAFSFAWAVRLIMVWWFAALPLVGFVFAAIPAARTRGLRGARIFTSFVIVLLPAMRLGILREREPLPRGARAENGRSLPVDVADVLEPLILRLEGQPPSCGHRIMTAFDLGSYLTWRLPGYSVSEDSRGIFPDSVLLPEAFHTTDDGPENYGVWRSADIAIIPLRYGLAPVLDSASAWRRVATAVREHERVSSSTARPLGVGLWVRESHDGCANPVEP